MAQPDTVAKSWISHTPGVCGGEACIRATRHTVAGYVQWRRLGLSDDGIRVQHPDLTQADLEVAWQYYQDHQGEIDAAIKADEGA
jgi:uncharacterized protein (DUF433 family)